VVTTHCLHVYRHSIYKTGLPLWQGIAIVICMVFSLHANSLFDQGNELYRQGKFEKAIKIYEQVLEQDVNRTLVYYNMGNAWYQLSNLTKATACYKMTITESPDFFPGYLNLGIVLHELADWPSTIVILEEARTVEPLNQQVLLILSVAYKNLKVYSEAIRCLKEALALDSTQYNCYFLLYDIYQEIDDWYEAQYYLKKYPDSGSRADEKYRLLGGIAEIEENWEYAMQCYRRQINISPNNKWAWYKIIEISSLTGKPLLAIDYAHTALQQYPDFGELALLAGNIAFNTSQWDHAEQFYRQASRSGEARGLIGLQNIKKAVPESDDLY